MPTGTLVSHALPTYSNFLHERGKASFRTSSSCHLHRMHSWMRRPLRRRELLDIKEKPSPGRSGKKKYMFIFTTILGFCPSLAYSTVHPQFPYLQLPQQLSLQGLRENGCWSQLLLQLGHALLIHILTSSACFLGSPVIHIWITLYDLG